MITSFVEKMQKKNTEADMGKYPPVSIAFLGDSVTQGAFRLFPVGETGFQTEFDASAAYCSRLKQLINTIYPRVYLNILNAGVAGEGAAAGKARLERDILPYHPDLLVISFGLNDCGGGEEGCRRFADNIRDMVRRARAAGSEVIYLSVNSMAAYVDNIVSQPGLRGIADYSAKMHKLGWDRRYYEAAGKAVVEEGGYFCDANARWQALEEGGADMTALLCNHINHPSKELHWLFAASLFETIFL